MLSFGELKRNLKKNPTSFPKIRIALLGDKATQFLAIAIQGMGYERSVHIELFEAEYNQIEHQFSDPNSELFAFSPDIIVLFHSTHKLLVKYGKLPPELRKTLAQDRLQFLESAWHGKFKKCLILDLDNTLWGGVIGDDGLERIQIGHGLGIGKAFSEFQLWVKKLHAHGHRNCDL